MSLTDRRLLLELGAVLVIKLILIILLKIFFFSPDTENIEPVTSRFLHTETSPQPLDHTDKER
ncbi:cytochrome oxidase putative small subunit CydP [uncultured Microbulbifer sp.]|uniref:cytochrome oxidase putative small subunit CydP n=1 Tax=uncultured Microbulbifer sp. TaxID=348147 RepID=UPI0025F49470|nr:cytochrome oxidase putative small subunit CydP [uncultured Microbulbifer sp.]